MGDSSENKPKKHICAALLAHVDAGKTTLSEALLYTTGQIRSLGRVDHQDAYLDNDAQERERGITIFSKQAGIESGDFRITLLDTPGHVDFSAEMERTLQILDYAVLVISGTDGVQGHTRTLWRLLRHYHVPVFLFVNKMDLDGSDREKIDAQLKKELSDGCVDFSGFSVSPEEKIAPELYEELAVCREELLNEYMESGMISEESIRSAIAQRFVFPCFYGSALKLEGVAQLLEGMKAYTQKRQYPQEFAARVYKIGRDERGVRLTYLKVTGGRLSVKDCVSYGSLDEKIDQIRIYSGVKYSTVETAEAGEVCVVTGLTGTFPGLGLGTEDSMMAPVLEPVLTYRVFLPKEVSPVEMMGKLRQLEEEEPQLHIAWDEQLQEIHVQMMGQIQIEVLTRQIKDRFGVVATFGPGNIVYRETIAKPVEGIGHFEPLRHYAEVHILLEPGEPGSGIQVASACSEDILDQNWQRLIATHIKERDHKGVLTGSNVTDIKYTILTGRAHQKHTEGGDFRQATYRAIRQGLKSTECILLEPYYHFSLEIPVEDVGRAMTDLEQRFAKFGSPEYVQGIAGEQARIEGTAPVSAMQDYMSQVNAYTRGLGHLSLTLGGYDVCHNSEEVIAQKAYDSEADLANPTGSVFCAHGAGFVVPWDEVERYMHMERAYHPKEDGESAAVDGLSYDYEGQSYHAGNLPGAHPGQASWGKKLASMSELEIDAQLQDVYAREFGMSREDVEEQERRKWAKKRQEGIRPGHVKYDKKGNPIYPARKQQEEMLIVDGYNIIFAWQDLKELSRTNIDAARDRLKDILLNYQGYRKCRLLLVFDAYKVRENPGREEFYDGVSRKSAAKTAGNSHAGKADTSPSGIEVVYTRQHETADAYIEKTVHQISDRYRVTVATSDGMEQLTVLSMGALRLSAADLKREIDRLGREAYEDYRRRQTE